MVPLNWKTRLGHFRPMQPNQKTEKIKKQNDNYFDKKRGNYQGEIRMLFQMSARRTILENGRFFGVSLTPEVLGTSKHNSKG